jgi:hypothetical protein
VLRAFDCEPDYKKYKFLSIGIQAYGMICNYDDYILKNKLTVSASTTLELSVRNFMATVRVEAIVAKLANRSAAIASIANFSVATGFSLCRSATTMSRRSPCRFSGAFSLSFRSPLRTLCAFFLPYISINDIYRKLKAMKNDSVHLETELWKDQSGSKFVTHNQLC